MYIENPKTKGSGIKCVIPQKDKCTVGCADCFFNNGRSYLEPVEEHIPNIPEVEDNVIYRINDGNDSSIDVDEVIRVAQKFPMRFYNTSFIDKLHRFDAPVVLTINPGEMTDKDFHQTVSPNIMFVRFRCNTWNFRKVGVPAIMWYVLREVPIVLTFMAYLNLESIPVIHRDNYERKKRTLNEYWCIKEDAWTNILQACKSTSFGKWVHSCGTSEIHECKFCGNCLREYFRVSCK